MQKQRIILIIGIVLALIVVLMIKVYLDQQLGIAKDKARTEYAKNQANQIAVLFAKEDIPLGSIIDSDTPLYMKDIPSQSVPGGAAPSLDRISGMVVALPISKDEPITLSKLSQARSMGDLASVTPVGKRAVSITVDDIASLGGMIKPQDYVDVIAMLPIPMQTPEGKTAAQTAVMPLFQNVLILAVGQEIGSPRAQPQARYRSEPSRTEAAGLITLALTPQEANLIAFVQEQGKLRLILRSPSDAKVEAMAPASWDTLFQYVMPQTAQSPPARQAEPAEAEAYVEIYRGLNKEKVPLNK